MGSQSVKIEVSDALMARLEDVAARTGHSMDDLLKLALGEFAENWQDFLADQETLDISDDERHSLRVVGD